MKFSVWAPRARQSVELVSGAQRFPMKPDDQGHWSVDCHPSHIEQGYRYAIDGKDPVPDPRSAWQPDGVHGPSHLVDTAALRAISRSDFRQKPLSQAIIYEIHIGTFSPEGTYMGAARKLPHLVSLGVTHVEVMPLATFPGHHGWGYDGVYLYAPQPSYGTPEQLAQFVAACHDHGLAVLLDCVYNHLGPDGNYLNQYAPYFTDQVKTAWGDAINYDGAHSDGVREFVLDNARMWVDVYGFDGLRLDAVGAIFSFEAVHLLEELASAVHEFAQRHQRKIVLIAESDLNDPRLVHSPERGGYGLDAHWADDFHHALHSAMTGENIGYYMDFDGIKHLALALRDGYIYQGQYSPHRKRRHGRKPSDVRPDQLVVNSQNHDQIGNRAKGERLSMLLTPIQLKAVAAITLLSPFVPLMFQGEEWGATTPFFYFTDHQDKELGRLVAEGRRQEFHTFGWADDVPNPQLKETYDSSRLPWSELERPTYQDLFQWYRQVIELRHSDHHPHRLPIDVGYDADQRWLWFVRGELCVVVNFAKEPAQIPLPAGPWRLTLSSVSADSKIGALAGYETQILRRDS